MNQEELKKILPHRDNMLLIDECELVDGEAHGKCHIRPEQWFLQGHFPGNPVVPGVILCEMLAQTSCVLLKEDIQPGQLSLFTSLDKVRFKHPVYPGDTLETKVRLTRQKKPFYFAEGEGYVNGKLCVKAEFSFAITGV